MQHEAREDTMVPSLFSVRWWWGTAANVMGSALCYLPLSLVRTALGRRIEEISVRWCETADWREDPLF